MNDPTPTPPRMTDQAPELLPCPFCGNAAKIRCHDDDEATIMCANDACRLVVGVPATKRAIAIKNWNTRPTPAERPVAEGLEQHADAVDMPATIGELEQMICIEFPSSVATRHAAERVYNFLYARISIRAKTLARRTTTSGLPHCEGQAAECDGGLHLTDDYGEK